MRLCMRPVRRVEDAGCVATLFPGFAETINRLAGETAIAVDE